MRHDSLLIFSKHQKALNVVCFEMPQLEHVTIAGHQLPNWPDLPVTYPDASCAFEITCPCRRKVTPIPLPLGCPKKVWTESISYTWISCTLRLCKKDMTIVTMDRNLNVFWPVVPVMTFPSRMETGFPGLHKRFSMWYHSAMLLFWKGRGYTNQHVAVRICTSL